MEVVISVLAMLALMAAITGLIRPSIVLRWGNKKTRIRAFGIYFVVFLLFSLLYPANYDSVSEKKDSINNANSEKINRDKVLQTKFLDVLSKRDIKYKVKAEVLLKDNKIPSKKELMATARHISSLDDAKNKYVEFYLPGTYSSKKSPFAIYFYNSDSKEKYLLDPSKDEKIIIYETRIPENYKKSSGDN
jgi:hypothetical protein